MHPTITYLITKAQEPQTIWFILGAMFSALGAHLWRRYMGRMVTLKWEINCQKIGSTTADNFGSKVEIRYDDIAWENIYYVFVRITNDTSVDLGDFNLLFFFKNARGVLQSEAGLTTSDKRLLHSDDFQKTVSHVTALPQDQRPTSPSWAYIHRNREYRVPALNRGAGIIASFVVCPANAAEPNVSITTEHKGVRLVRESVGPKLFGVDTGRASLYGIFVGTLIALVLPTFVTSPLTLSLTVFVIGLAGNLVGVAVIKLARGMFKFLG
jgi:hypothetical protein